MVHSVCLLACAAANQRWNKQGERLIELKMDYADLRLTSADSLGPRMSRTQLSRHTSTYSMTSFLLSFFICCIALCQPRTVTASHDISSSIIAPVKYFVTCDKYFKVTNSSAAEDDVISRLIGTETLNGVPWQAKARGLKSSSRPFKALKGPTPPKG